MRRFCLDWKSCYRVSTFWRAKSRITGDSSPLPREFLSEAGTALRIRHKKQPSINRLLFALLLSLSSLCPAIDLVAPASPVKPSALVTIPIRDVSQADQSRVQIDWTPKVGVTVIPASWGGQSFLIFQATDPGEYKITANINGWAKSLSEAVRDSEKYPIDAEKRAKWLELTNEIIAGNAYAEVTATVTVEGAKPDVPTPPVPVVSGKRTIVILRETATATPAIARLITAMRDSSESREWKTKGHTVYVLDKDAAIAKGWVSLSGGKLPALMILDESGKLLFCGDVPGSVKDVDSQVKLVGG